MLNIFTCYRLLSQILRPLAGGFYHWRLSRGKEVAGRFPERMGHASLPRPQGEVIWLHAASNGEAMSLLPLLQQLTIMQPLAHFLVTSGTATSAELMRQHLPKNTLHQMVPWDFPDSWERFLAYWRPQRLILVEQELWPNMIFAAKAHLLPIILVNGRLSQKSFQQWQKFSSSAQALLSSLTLILARDEAAKSMFLALGAKHVVMAGDLKQAAEPLPYPCSQNEAASWQALVAPAPVIMLASSHQGEDELMVKAFITLRQTYPALTLILAPRHHQRVKAVVDFLQQSGNNFLLHHFSSDSGWAVPTTKPDIIIVGRQGVLGLFYRLAHLVIIGNSFLPHGKGHNPLEAVNLARPVMIGPYHVHCVDMVADLAKADALKLIDPEKLADDIALALSPENLLRQQAAAKSYADKLEQKRQAFIITLAKQVLSAV